MLFIGTGNSCASIVDAYNIVEPIFQENISKLTVISKPSIERIQ